MSVLSCLKGSIQSFEPVPAGARIFEMRTVFEGAGGAWRAGLWYVGFRRIRAVVIPEGGGCPVALGSEWSRSEPATALASHFARFAAETELVTV